MNDMGCIIGSVATRLGSLPHIDTTMTIHITITEAFMKSTRGSHQARLMDLQQTHWITSSSLLNTSKEHSSRYKHELACANPSTLAFLEIETRLVCVCVCVCAWFESHIVSVSVWSARRFSYVRPLLTSHDDGIEPETYNARPNNFKHRSTGAPKSPGM